MLERPARARRQVASARQRRERKQRYEIRRAAGRIVVPVEIGETVISGLVAIGWLREGNSTDARRIGAAIAEMLADSFK
jgi:hypothetical protein